MKNHTTQLRSATAMLKSRKPRRIEDCKADNIFHLIESQFGFLSGMLGAKALTLSIQGPTSVLVQATKVLAKRE